MVTFKDMTAIVYKTILNVKRISNFFQEMWVFKKPAVKFVGYFLFPHKRFLLSHFSTCLTPNDP